MFDKVLVANRGAVAARVLRALYEMRIKSVAVYSEADYGAPYLELASETHAIGPAPAGESYLNQERLIEVIQRSGADGVHPGYGFLSENASFAEACGKAEIAFIGPTPQVIHATGDKVNAKKTLAAAGVPVVPGWAGTSVRGYISTAFVCPFEGKIAKEQVDEVVRHLSDCGVDELAISDTIGAAVPTDVMETIEYVLRSTPRERIALHFHDTYGTALANVLAGLQLGVTTFDSSAGGLGGCPFAPGASGNLATEDLVYMLDEMKIRTGVNAAAVVDAADTVGRILGRPLCSAQWRRTRGAQTKGRRD